MMKRLLLSCLVLSVAMVCSAQDSIYIGNIGIDNENLQMIPYDSYKGACSRVSSAVVKKYADKEAIGLRVCFGSYVITDIHTFLSADPDPEKPETDLASTTLEYTMTGWSDVFFDTPYTLKGTEGDVYMGYYFTCPDTEENPAAEEYPVVFGSGKITHGLLLYDYSEDYKQWGWFDYSSMGILAVQLILHDKVADTIEYVQTDTHQPATHPVYDMAGRRVGKQNTRPGLYIRDGRKVVRR